MKKASSKPKRKPAHLCFKQVDEFLAKHNTRLDLGLTMNFDAKPVTAKVNLAVGTTKVDQSKRAKPKTVICVFCPFCGVNLDEVGPN